MTSPTRTRSPTLTTRVDDLAGDAEPEIGLVAGAHDADEFARRGAGLERDPLHLHRTLRLRAGAVSAWQAASSNDGADRGDRERHAAGTRDLIRGAALMSPHSRHHDG